MSNADIRGRFIWHELVTTDPDAAAAFYSKVVSWKTQDSGIPSYRLWMAGKTRIGGLTGLPDGAPADTPPQWILYIATPDVDATVAAAQRLGARVTTPGTDIPNNMGRFAVLTDPQGATFAVYTPPAGPPPEGSEDASGEFGWHELATTDHAAALRFYSELFGWEKGPGHDMGQMGIYQLIVHEGRQVGGIYNAQGPAAAPGWLTYFRVADCSKATAAAKAAGGRVLNGPMQVPGGSWITQLMDPQGGTFAVTEPSLEEAQKPAKPAAPKKPARAVAASSAEAAPAAAAPAAAKTAKRKAPRKVTRTAKPGKARPAAKKKAAKAAAPKKAAKKTAKKTAKKAVRKAAGKAGRGAGAKRGKPMAKKSSSKAKRGGKKAKRR